MLLPEGFNGWSTLALWTPSALLRMKKSFHESYAGGLTVAPCTSSAVALQANVFFSLQRHHTTRKHLSSILCLFQRALTGGRPSPSGLLRVLTFVGQGSCWKVAVKMLFFIAGFRVGVGGDF